uniref:Uncharacterized protein n=1 Tax=Daphnia galeata TaxID=27404 RepID=A0A8J2RLM7_9CRUS|nr:unnamed protein product [Daphnia galeata]
MQSVHSLPSKNFQNFTTNPSYPVKEILHQKMLQLMGVGSGTEINVKQHVVTEVDPGKKSFEQLVIQKIILKVG